MQVETEPARCARPECIYPPRFTLTEHGFDMNPWCSAGCETWFQYAVVVARMPESEAAEALSKQLYDVGILLNGRGDSPTAFEEAV